MRRRQVPAAKRSGAWIFGRAVVAGMLAALLLPFSYLAAVGASSVWTTYQHDPARDALDPDVGAISTISQAWTSTLDGAMYAQPLVLGSTVYAATENDTIYAFDANTGLQRWKQHFATPASLSQLPCGNIDPYGITGTPVIDAANNVLYAAALTNTPTIHHELYALDLNNAGAVLYHYPIDAPGSDPSAQGQRGALTLANGKVYVVYAGRWGDCGTYKGRVVGVNAGDSTGTSLVSYSLPNTSRGGIWAAASADASGNLYVATGNSNATGSTPDHGESVIKLSSTLQELDFFTAPEWQNLNITDTDIGSIGPSVLQNGWLLQSGKDSMGYLINSANMGHVGGQLFEGVVCDNGEEALGFGAYLAPSTVFIPCTHALKAVHVNTTGTPSFTVTTVRSGYLGDPGAGPPIIAGGVVWNLDVGASLLLGFDANTGQKLFQQTLPSAPRNFAAPSSGAGHLFVPANRTLMAFSVNASPPPPATATPTTSPTSAAVSTNTPTPTPSTATGQSVPLVGDSVIEGTSDSTSAGEAEAFQYVATQSGVASQLVAFIDSGTTAANIVLGLYSDANGQPGTLLNSAQISNPVLGAWNTAPMAGTNISAGTRYWIALLAPAGGGTLRYRDVANGTPSQTSSQVTLTNLPGTWSSGASWPSSPMSAYAATSASPALVTATPTRTPTATPTPTSTSAPATATSTPTAQAATTLLLGDNTVEGTLDTDRAGTAEAFQYVAASSGTAGHINVYVDASNTATQLVVGLYAHNAATGGPGTLLAQAVLSAPRAGAWNSVAISPVTISLGTRYWIAVLGPAGGNKIAYRDRGAGSTSFTSSATTLSSLPASWTSGASWPSSPASAYVSP